jgi:hypothetical protein
MDYLETQKLKDTIYNVYCIQLSAPCQVKFLRFTKFSLDKFLALV